jgi:Anti-sigma-K factor rskA
VSRAPDFHDLVGDDLPAEERKRLQRVHDLLVASGPPPDLPAELAEPPRPGAKVAFLPRQRLRTGLVLAAALVVAAFAAGYFFGDRDEPATTPSFATEQTVVLGEDSPVAVVRIGNPDEAGNRPMLVTVEGLRSLPTGDYYSLFMTRKGKPIVPCGTFRVENPDQRTFRLNVAYDPSRYDGMMLAEYRASDHKDHPVLEAPL